jgi:hypothetical protein
MPAGAQLASLTVSGASTWSCPYLTFHICSTITMPIQPRPDVPLSLQLLLRGQWRPPLEPVPHSKVSRRIRDHL